MSYYFADQSWPQLEKAIAENALIILPIAQIEEHGRHLPVSTDTVIATEIASVVAQHLQEELPVLVMPTVWASYSMKAMTLWPGCMTVRPKVMMDYVLDICSSLIEMGFAQIIMLNCHGSNQGLLRSVCRQISDKYGVWMSLISPLRLARERFQEIRKSAAGGTTHAGEVETSLMLHFGQPVDMEEATDEDILRYHSDFVAGDMLAGSKIGGVYWSTFALQQSKTGTYGDPTVAAADTGRALMEAIVDHCVAFAREFYAHDRNSF